MESIIKDEISKYVGTHLNIAEAVFLLKVVPIKVVVFENFIVVKALDDNNKNYNIMFDKNYNFINIYHGSLDDLDRTKIYDEYAKEKLTYPLNTFSIKDINELRVSLKEHYEEINEPLTFTISCYIELIDKLTLKFLEEYNVLSDYDFILSDYCNYINYFLESLYSRIELGVFDDEEKMAEEILTSLQLSNDFYFVILGIIDGIRYEYTDSEYSLEDVSSQLLLKK